jgi:hypothetical protein
MVCGRQVDAAPQSSENSPPSDRPDLEQAKPGPQTARYSSYSNRANRRPSLNT